MRRRPTTVQAATEGGGWKEESPKISTPTHNHFFLLFRLLQTTQAVTPIATMNKRSACLALLALICCANGE